MNILKNEDGWVITTRGILSDAEARDIVFAADPEQVLLGEYVEVADAEGTRIGHVSRATLVRHAFHPDTVRIEIDLM